MRQNKKGQARATNDLDTQGPVQGSHSNQRRCPDVIVIGGFSLNTTNLSRRVKETVGRKPPVEQPQSWRSGSLPPLPESEPNVPVIYAQDEVAHIFQHSKRAEEEFSTLSTISGYCVGLAHCVQSPLGEYAALGSNVVAISFNRYHQNSRHSAKSGDRS